MGRQEPSKAKHVWRPNQIYAKVMGHVDSFQAIDYACAGCTAASIWPSRSCPPTSFASSPSKSPVET